MHNSAFHIKNFSINFKVVIFYSCLLTLSFLYLIFFILCNLKGGFKLLQYEFSEICLL